MMNPTPPCCVCGSPVEMGAPEVRFSNGPSSSVIVIEHRKQVMCPTCGTALHLAVVGIQNVQLQTVKVAPTKEPLVIPASRVKVG